MKYLEKYYPYGVYLLITVIIFSDFLFSNGVLFSSDQLESGVFFRNLYREFFVDNYSIPIWNRFISGGIPFVDATHGDTFYPLAFLKFFIPLYKALGLKLVIHVFLAGCFTYSFLRTYGIGKVSSFIGGIVYMVAPMLVSLVYPGHDAKMYVAALFPLAFKYLYLALNDSKLRYFIYFGTAVGFMLLSSHIQTTYFGLWILFFYTVYRLIKSYISDKNLKSVTSNFGLFWVGILVGLLIGAVQLIPPYFYAKEFSIRGSEEKTSFEHAISWSMHPEEAMSLVVPEFPGDNRMGHVATQEEYDNVMSEGGSSYWGRNAFKLNSEYSGVIAIVVFLAALVAYKGRRKSDLWFWFGSGVFVLLYSLVNHTPLFYLVYKVVPGVKYFRGQGMILYILTFVLTVGVAIFLDMLSRRKESSWFNTKEAKETVKNNDSIASIGELQKAREAKEIDYDKFAVFSYIIAGLFIAGFVLFPIVFEIYKSIFEPIKTPSDEYMGIIRMGILYSGILVITTLVFVHLLLKRKVKFIHVAVVLALLFFIDGYRVDRKYVKVMDKDALGIKFKTDGLIEQLQEQYKLEQFRVLNMGMYGTNELGIHGIETVRGFHDNELKNYRVYRGINESGVNTDKNILNGLRSGSENNLLNIAGTKYILFKDDKGKPAVLPNENYMPRAYVVSNYEVIDNDKKAIERMLSEDFDYRNTVVLTERPEIEPQAGDMPAGKVLSYEYRGNEVFAEVEMDRDGILFISDNYFPYWHAYSDNKELKILKANVTFRAIPLEKGKHQIEFKFHSPYYFAGGLMTISGLLVFGVTIVITRKNKI